MFVSSRTSSVDRQTVGEPPVPDTQYTHTTPVTAAAGQRCSNGRACSRHSTNVYPTRVAAAILESRGEQ